MTARTRTYKDVVPAIAPTEQESPEQQPARIEAQTIIIVVVLLIAVVLMVRFAVQKINERRMPVTPTEIELRTGSGAYPIVRLKIEPDGDGFAVTDEDGDRFWCPVIPKVMSDEEKCHYVGG